MFGFIIVRRTSVHISFYVMVHYYQTYIYICPYHTICDGLLLLGVHWYQSISHSMSWYIIIRRTLVSVYTTLYVVMYYYQAFIGISPYHTLCLGLLFSGLHWYQYISHTMSWFIITKRTLVSVYKTLYVLVYYYQAFIGINPYHTLCRGILLSDVHWYQSISHAKSWFIIITRTLVSVYTTLYVLVYYYQAFIGISPYHTLCRSLLLSDVHWYQSISHSMSWFIIVRRTLVSVYITR